MGRRLPKLLGKVATAIHKKSQGKRGLDKSAAFAIATASLQKAGYLKKGTNKLTKRGRRKRI